MLSFWTLSAAVYDFSKHLFSTTLTILQRGLALQNIIESLTRMPPGRGFRIMGCGFAGLVFVDLLWFLASCVYCLMFFERISWKQSTNKCTKIDQTSDPKQSKIEHSGPGGQRGTRQLTKIWKSKLNAQTQRTKMRNMCPFKCGEIFSKIGGLNGSTFTVVLWKMVIEI